LFGGSEDGVIYEWDINRGRVTQMFEGHGAGVLCLAMGPDSHLFSGSADHCVMEWDVVKGRHVRTYQGHTGPVTSLAIALSAGGTDRGADRGGSSLLTGSSDHTVREWSLESGLNSGLYSDHMSTVTTVQVSTHGGMMVTGSEDATVRVWRMPDPPQEARGYREDLPPRGRSELEIVHEEIASNKAQLAELQHYKEREEASKELQETTMTLGK